MQSILKNLSLVSLFFILNSSSCEEDFDIGFDEEPAIQIVFHDGNQNFITESASINKPKKSVIQDDLPGIDMNANSTKYWISRGNKTDSFEIFYKIHASLGYKKTLMHFDTIYIKESSFINARFINNLYPGDSVIDFKYSNPCPVFYIR